MATTLFNGAIWDTGKNKKLKRSASSSTSSSTHKRPKVKKTRKKTWEYVLDIDIMRRDPSLNFEIWDVSEIVPLENYREQFAHLSEANKDCQFFYENWVNCDKAIHYFYEKIMPLWKRTDETVPLKEAIRTGKVIPLFKQSTVIEKQNMVELHKSGVLTQKLEKTQVEMAKELMMEKKTGTLTIQEWLSVRGSNDEEFKGILDENKENPDVLNLVVERKDPCPSEEFDPTNVYHQSLCVVESHQAQFLIDNEEKTVTNSDEKEAESKP